MDPNKDTRGNRDGDISGLRDAGIDIVSSVNPQDEKSTPDGVGVPKNTAVAQTNENTEIDENRGSATPTITDKIPNVFVKPKENDTIKNRSVPEKPRGPDSLNEVANKITSSVPSTSHTEAREVTQQGEKPLTMDEILGTKTRGEKQKPIDDPSIKPLRTYKTDVEEAIRNQRMSVVNIAVAETKRNEKERVMAPVRQEKISKSSSGAPVFLLSIIFLLAGAGALYFVFFRDIEVNPVVAEEAFHRVAKEDSTKDLVITEFENPIVSYVKAIDSLGDTSPGDIVRLKPVIIGELGQKEMSPKDFFREATPFMPGRLSRSLSNFALGVHVSDSNVPFLVLFTKSFQNAFAGMLEWEKNIPKELEPLLQFSYSTSSSSGVFYDKVVKNKDTRVLRDALGNEMIWYTFMSNDTIVITTKQKTLEELITRFVSTRVTR